MHEEHLDMCLCSSKEKLYVFPANRFPIDAACVNLSGNPQADTPPDCPAPCSQTKQFLPVSCFIVRNRFHMAIRHWYSPYPIWIPFPLFFFQNNAVTAKPVLQFWHQLFYRRAPLHKTPSEFPVPGWPRQKGIYNLAFSGSSCPDITESSSSKSCFSLSQFSLSTRRRTPSSWALSSFPVFLLYCFLYHNQFIAYCLFTDT